MGIFNRWTSKQENDEAKGKRAASVIKKAQEIKKEEVKEEVKAVEGKEEKKKVVKAEKVSADVIVKNAHKVLMHPVITEKSTYSQSEGVYVFEVFPSATKTEAKKAVQALYKVKVTGIRIVNLKGKQVRFGRVQGRRNARKKAMVTLQKGQNIELHKNV
ncbi:MAG: 50S ribosomal protein L23 [Candidatus Magasanikbacteria bacterium]|nr:50S ribosomal protein L23 [Candidatus Magasanikbacteria bacterium]